MPSSHEYVILLLNRKLGIPPRQPATVDRSTDVRANDRYTSREARNRSQEIAKQHRYAVRFHDEPYKGPPHDYEYNAGEEGRRPFGFLFPREEEHRLLGADDDRQANKEEYLWSGQALSCVTDGKGGGKGFHRRTFPMASL